MNFGSLFTGIGGFDLALTEAGMRCMWQVEIDKRCSEVLERHFPMARRYADVREVGQHNLKPVELICGGFPCQDLSVAGKRDGLAGTRSGLWWEFARIVDELEPKWVVVENVPGLLSSKRGSDFEAIIRWLADRGYGVCWRVLDAQYFGVPQRRRRVFVVGSLGDGCAAKVLFEQESMCGSAAPRAETRQEVACWSPASFGGYTEGVGTLRSYGGDVGGGSETLTATDSIKKGVLAFNWQSGGDCRLSVGKNPSALHAGQTPAIWVDSRMDSFRISEGVSPTLTGRMGTGGNNVPLFGIRRLMPIECERLQGFPDNWTQGFADSRRYKMLGNAVAVPVVRWIAERIMRCKDEQIQ